MVRDLPRAHLVFTLTAGVLLMFAGLGAQTPAGTQQPPRNPLGSAARIARARSGGRVLQGPAAPRGPQVRGQSLLGAPHTTLGRIAAEGGAGNPKDGYRPPFRVA